MPAGAFDFFTSDQIRIRLYSRLPLNQTVTVYSGRNRDRAARMPVQYQNFTGFEVRYLFTISATLKVIASSNSLRSSPVIFLIFSSL